MLASPTGVGELSIRNELTPRKNMRNFTTNEHGIRSGRKTQKEEMYIIAESKTDRLRRVNNSHRRQEVPKPLSLAGCNMTNQQMAST